MTSIYACVYAYEFPAQALLRESGKLRQSFVAVLTGAAPAERICSLTRAARNLGMAPGMTRVEAESFPGALLLARDLASESHARTALLDCLAQFTPRIQQVSATQIVPKTVPESALTRIPDTACAFVMDLTGTQQLFGTPREIALRVLRQAEELGLTIRIGISANFNTAVCLAQGPRKLECAAAGQEAEALARLPLSLLPLESSQAETLNAWGINSFGALAALPERELIARMGQSARQLRLLARGEAPHHFQPIEAPFALNESIEFEEPVDLLEPLLFCLNPIFERLIAAAQDRALAIATLEIRANLEGAGVYQRTVRPAVPTIDRTLLLKLVQLDMAAHPPAAGVLNLRVTALAGPRSKVQIGLFAPQLPESGRLDITLARLAALVGEDRVGWAERRDTHHPDAFTMQPFQVTAAARHSSPQLQTHSACAALRRIRPPAQLAVGLEGVRPARFFYGARQYRVEHCYGPWQRSGSWWSREIWSIENWDVVARAHDGELLVAVLGNDRLRSQWQLEALYD